MSERPLRDTGTAEDSLTVQRDPAQSKSDQAFDELDDLRRRAGALGIPHETVPLGELRAQVEAAEADRA